VRAAIDGQEGFVADERELLRQGRSYSYDTLASLREEVGPQVRICLLTGADAFQNFASWHRPEDILSIAHVVVMQRPQAAAPDHPVVRDWSTQRLAEGPNTLRTVSGGHILFQEVTQLGISATTIRGLVAKGLSPRYLVPDRVLEIIEREGLYRR
jgi:nicotinate-nucleotide adenylyltransferase